MRRILAFFAITLAVPAFAEDGDSCPDGGGPLPRVPVVEQVLANIDWWAATESQVENAHCRAGIPSEREMRDWLTANPGAETVRATRTIHGVRLENQPVALLDLFERLTTTRRHDRSDQATLSVPASCRAFDCAVDAVFPAGTGVRIAYLAARYGFNASDHSGLAMTGSNDTDPLDREELDDIISGVTDMPEQLPRAMWNHPIQHFSRGYTLAMYGEDSATLANARISLFDLWTSSARPRRQYAILHEIGHQIGSKLGLDSSERWLRLSGWTRDASKAGTAEEWTASRPGALVSHYAGTNPSEDFAESVVAYRYNPDLLRRVSPGKYELIRDVVYDGVEFTSQQACSNAVPRSRQLRDSLTARARTTFGGRPWPRVLQDSGAIRACRDQMFDQLAASGPASTRELEQCVSGALRAHVLDRSSLDPDYVRMLEKSGALVGGQDVFANAGGAIMRTLRAEVQEGMRQAVVQEILGRDTLALRVAINQGEAPARYCATQSRYIYQRASHLRDRFEDPGASPAGFLFHRREQLAAWANSICLRAMGGATTVFAPTEDAVRTATNAIFADSRSPASH